MDCDELDRVLFSHPIYDAEPTGSDPFWYRGSLNTGYQFRLGPRDPDKPQPSCRIDLDESGDYDPSARRRKQLLPPVSKRERAPPQTSESEEPLQKKPRPLSWQNGRFNGLSLPVTLTLVSERGRALLESMGDGANHWPLDDQSSSSGSHDSISWSDSTASSFSSLSACDEEPYMLRRRERANGDRHSVQEDDDFDLSRVTLGHPAARGCIPCLKLRLPCTLLQEGAKYPCQNCVEDDCDCELVLPPHKKRSCEGCRRRRLRCSYIEPGSDHDRACRTCSNIGVHCIAGPASGRMRIGPSLDQLNPGLASDVMKSRPFVSCTQCRQAKKKCSLRNYHMAGPCSRCEADETTCTFEPLPRPSLQTKCLQLEAEKSAAEDLSTEEQPDPASTSHSDPGPDPIAVEQQSPTDLKAITTRLPQPVLFNQEPPESCSWCVDPLHGLLGLGIVHPLVHDTPSGYIELSGGHIAEGYLPSRMCVTCTLDRFRIVGCEGHEMHKLDEDAETNRLHAEDALESFVAGQADWEWCCICPRPAVYGCGRPTEGFDDEEAVIGCGLRLCEKCAETITSECEGDLETLVAMKMSEAEGREDHESIVRADADLLTRNGELLRRAALL